MPVLIHAREDERAALDALEAEMSSFAALERLDAQGVHELCPLLKDDALTASPTGTASASTRMRCSRAICASCGAAAASFTPAQRVAAIGARRGRRGR